MCLELSGTAAELLEERNSSSSVEKRSAYVTMDEMFLTPMMVPALGSHDMHSGCGTEGVVEAVPLEEFGFSAEAGKLPLASSSWLAEEGGLAVTASWLCLARRGIHLEAMVGARLKTQRSVIERLHIINKRADKG